MDKQSPRVNLFDYLDYREFLRDWYHQAKESRASFSFRTFSKRAGFQSTNIFKLVMDGERNLTEESLVKFMIGLKLNKQEQEFFRNLVFFNQSKGHKEKDFYYKRLLRCRKFSQLKSIEKSQYEYYSAWYHTVVRELAVSNEFDGTPEWLAERLFPPITPTQAAKSLELLEKLGFIKKTRKNKWEQSSTVISTGPEVKSLAIFNYHKNLLDLSKEILEKIDPQKRDVSAMTLGVARERIPLIKRKVQEFRKEILKLVSLEEHPNAVLQLNIQMFPVSKPKEEDSP